MDNPYCVYDWDYYEVDKKNKLRFEIFKSLLSPFLKDGVKVLDLGCGTGHLFNVLPSTVDYLGIDSTEEALKFAERKGAKTMKADLNYELPLDEKFDIIVLTEVLEHLYNPESMINQVKALVKHDSVILIALPNENTLYHRMKFLLGKGIDPYSLGYGDKHIHYPTITQSTQFATKHFDIIATKYFLPAGGRLEFILSKVPQRWLSFLANVCPSLFAYEVIYLCRLKAE